MLEHPPGLKCDPHNFSKSEEFFGVGWGGGMQELPICLKPAKAGREARRLQSCRIIYCTDTEYLTL